MIYQTTNAMTLQFAYRLLQGRGFKPVKVMKNGTDLVAIRVQTISLLMDAEVRGIAEFIGDDYSVVGLKNQEFINITLK